MNRSNWSIDGPYVQTVRTAGGRPQRQLAALAGVELLDEESVDVDGFDDFVDESAGFEAESLDEAPEAPSLRLSVR